MIDRAFDELNFPFEKDAFVTVCLFREDATRGTTLAIGAIVYTINKEKLLGKDDNLLS